MTEFPVIAACAPNLRDIGGLDAGDGHLVRRGLLYRSSHLAPSAEEEACIRALGIRAIIDLRSTHERDSAPNSFFAAEDVSLVEYDITTDFRAADHPLDHLRRDPGEAGAVALMKATYRQFPDAAGAAVRRAADLLILGRTPLLVHCTAGKDRTGFVCAMLLIAAGVPKDAVMADYLESRRRGHASVSDATRALVAHAGLDLADAALLALNDVRSDYLEESFSVLMSRHGGFDAYLDALAIDRARLREAMVD